MADEKYLKYFNEVCPEDVDDVLTVCEIASKELFQKFKMKFEDPRILACIWSKIYGAFHTYLKGCESEYTEFKINVADRLEIGYDTSKDEDDEKQGNFCIYIHHLNSDKKDDMMVEPSDKAKERAVQWNTNNIIDKPTILRDISIQAIDYVKEIDIQLGSSEFIMPIFIKVYEALIKYIKVKRRDTDQFEFTINFLSCFYITCRELEDGDDIDITPSIQSKLNLKNDAQASSVHE